MTLFNINVNYVVKGETEDHAINTLVKLANLNYATECNEIYECIILEVTELEPHEIEEYIKKAK